MNEMQSKLLDMLRWLDAYCRMHHIRYYVLGGTMLGAVRHKGFIPWDDDIDIGIPRADYERLCKMLQQSEDGKYMLETVFSEEQAYAYPFAKLYDTTTTLIENKKRELIRGIYIDIFPLDGIGNTKEEAQKNFKKVRRKFQFYLTRTCGIRQGRAWWKNLAVRLVSNLPFIDNRKLRIDLDHLCKKYDFDQCQWIGNIFGAWGFKEVMHREIAGQPTEYPFEDLTVYGAEMFDAYLSHLYGKWQELPPVDKQVSHHDYKAVDLNTSFHSYQNKA